MSVYSLELEAYTPPRAAFRVVCSRGTYIRALARDMAGALGTYAYCTALSRQRIGRFTLGEAVTPEEFDPHRHCVPAGVAVQRLSGISVVGVITGREMHLRAGKVLEEGCFTRPPVPGLNAAVDQNGGLVAVIDRRDGRMRYVMVLPE